MRFLAIHRTTGKVTLRLFAVLVLYLCISTVADTTALGRSEYHGLDVLTISGDRSSIEVFSVGGVYILHDYSLLIPGCTTCRAVKFQVDLGPTVGAHTSEVGARIVPQSFKVAESLAVGQRTFFRQPVELASRVDDLDIPPPRL